MTQDSQNSDNKIFIGNKPFMNYVTGVIMQFTTEDATEVIVKSRGKFISRAVDVAEVAVNKFLKDKIQIKDVLINSENFINKEGKEVRVSTIDIVLEKVTE
ncbi:MAG: DNA-binding protein Alba [Candidatus Woesearchaeota archaeon]